MASTVKCDTILLPDGSTPTAADLGIDNSGTILQVVKWHIPPTTVSTAGSWAYQTVPNGSNTYSVANTTFTKKSATSKIVGIAAGCVDPQGSTSAQSVVSLTNGGSSGATNGGTVYGATYFHGRYSNFEPYNCTFAFEDDMTTQSDPLNPVYFLRTHSTGSTMSFSQGTNAASPSMNYDVVFYEIEA